ncbi:stage III sporulation protein AF [Clostridium sp.]|jgi:stage III sporulation protein AF|uniref:stage III sporulation protein AF n=1 Tax=Clostridium sp. TaxID=1506 RepID=UPI002FDDF97C
MIESLRQWLIAICTAMFFITAIEMLLPDNSMKKYCRFALGLILITVFINPLVKVFNKDFDINSYTAKAIESFEENVKSEKSLKDFNEYKEKSKNDTIEAFENNLNSSCEKSLKEKYPDESYKVTVEADYDEESSTVCIKNVNVEIQKGSVEKVKRIDISGKTTSAGNFSEENSGQCDKIKNYLSKELDVSEDVVHINS